MKLPDVEPGGHVDPSPATFVEGLATGTYLAMRGKEECYRAQRYGRPLALVVAWLDQPDPATENRLQTWLRSQTRASDIVAYLGSSTYAMLLPESDQEGASGIIKRMRLALPQLIAFNGSYPTDGATWEDFFGNVCRKISEGPGDKKRRSQAS